MPKMENDKITAALSRLPQTVVVYDLETTGLSPQYDQILQIAAIRTDRSFAAPDHPKQQLELRARRQPWIIPSPAAMIVTRVTPPMLNEGIRHDEALARIEDFFKTRPSIYMTYNGLRFDEPFLANCLFRSVLSPYLTQARGSARADLIVIARTIAALDPEALAVPRADTGQPSFRLGPLCRRNGIDFPDNTAHDALADVRATAALAAHLSEISPDLFSQALALADKIYAGSILSPGAPIFHLRSRAGQPSARIIAVIALVPDDPNAVICVDLAADPEKFLHLPGSQLRDWLNQSPSPISILRKNAHEMLFSFDDSKHSDRLLQLVPTEAILPDYVLRARAAVVSMDDNFVARVLTILAERASERTRSPHVDEQLNEDLPCEVDILNYSRVIKRAFPRDRAWLAGQLRDHRLRELALRICYEDQSDQMEEELRLRLDAWKRKRLHSSGDSPWRTIAAARAEIDEMRRQIDARDEPRLREISEWLDSVEAETHRSTLRGDQP